MIVEHDTVTKLIEKASTRQRLGRVARFERRFQPDFGFWSQSRARKRQYDISRSE
mgnify:FL=1